MGIRENIIALRSLYNITQEELASIAGVSRGAVSQWEGGFSEPRMGAIQKIADYYNILKSNIIEDGGMDLIDPLTKRPRGARSVQGMPMNLVPKLGRAHAGVFSELENLEEKGEQVLIPQFLLDSDPDCFVVGSEGDCMDKVFAAGSDLVVSPNKMVREGSIVLATVDYGDTIVRRYHRMVSTLVLSPESHNDKYKDIVITDDSDHTVGLIGVIVWYQSSKEME